MKTFESYIQEMPLPKDWEKPFTIKGKWTQSNLDKVISFAISHSKTVGIGSSRVAFLVDYEGRQTVIKVAQKPNGLSQNKVEANILFHRPDIMGTGIVIPGIDCDTKNPPVWIHMEYATPIPNEAAFKKLSGGASPFDLVNYTAAELPHLPLDFNKEHISSFWVKEAYKNVDPTVIFVKRFLRFAELYKDIIDDFVTLRNWGVYKRNPVIIDMGLNSDNAKFV